MQKNTISLFKYVFKNTKYESLSYDNCVKLNDFETKYHFYVNFVEGKAPYLSKDEGYLSSIDLEELGLDSIDDINMINQETLFNNINRLNNVTITYYAQEDGLKCSPSSVISKLNVVEEKPKYEYGYSFVMDKIHLATIGEIYARYGVKDLDLDKYKLDIIDDKYDNSFKMNNVDIYNNYFNNLNKLVISYSSMNVYNQCPFKFYLDRVIKVSDSSDDTGRKLGEYAHLMIENSYNIDVDLDTLSDDFINNLDSPKKQFYASVMRKTIDEAIAFNNKNEEASSLKENKFETQIIKEIQHPFVLKGAIDRLMYEVLEDEVNVAIIDFKTSEYDTICLDNIEDGFNLQLPMYVYLLQEYEEFKNKKINIIGIYLQQILTKKQKSYEEFIASFRLQGYTILNTNLITKLDPYYTKSTYIKSMSITSKGDFNRYAKLITEDELNKFIPLIEDRINIVCQGIKNAKFDIKPKRIDKKNSTNICSFCTYKDICYVKEEDYIDIKPNKFGGE